LNGNYNNDSNDFIIPPQTVLEGMYIGITLSVRPSVSLFLLLVSSSHP